MFWLGSDDIKLFIHSVYSVHTVHTRAKSDRIKINTFQQLFKQNLIDYIMEGDAAPEVTLTPEQVKEIRDAFSVFDKDNSGSITSRELGVVMRSLGQSPTEAELYDMIEEADLDDNGSIDFGEFLQMMAKNYQVLNKDESVKAAFAVFDRDGDGFISAQEMRYVITSLGERFTEQEFDEMFDEADMDNDGYLSFDEFLRAYRT